MIFLFFLLKLKHLLRNIENVYWLTFSHLFLQNLVGLQQETEALIRKLTSLIFYFSFLHLLHLVDFSCFSVVLQQNQTEAD